MFNDKGFLLTLLILCIALNLHTAISMLKYLRKRIKERENNS